jgi:hypothetical protein
MRSFEYRRSLSREDWTRLGGVAAGAAIGIAGVVLYFGRIWLQRVPLPTGSERVATVDAAPQASRGAVRPRASSGSPLR